MISAEVTKSPERFLVMSFADNEQNRGMISLAAVSRIIRITGSISGIMARLYHDIGYDE